MPPRTASASVRHDDLETHDGEAQGEVERNGDKRADGAEALEQRVPQSLDRQSYDADADREPHRGAGLEESQSAEDQDGGRGDGGHGNRELASGDRPELCGVQTPAELKALPQPVRIDV